MKTFNVSDSIHQQAIPHSDQDGTENCQWQSGQQTPRTFCLINQKGGVGKSSSCFHLAGAYVSLGLRVLVIDTDPQGSISQGFFGSETVEQLPAEVTVAALFDDRWSFRDWNALIHETRFDRIHLCPANQRLAEFNTPCPEELGPIQYSLREFVEEQAGYDIVLIDCKEPCMRLDDRDLAGASSVAEPEASE